MSDRPLVVPFEVKEIKEEGDDFIVEGYASVYGNIDSYGDIVEQGAFSEDLIKNGMKRPILWQHSSFEPIGLGEFQDMERGLFVKIVLPKADTFVTGRVMPQVKIGSVTGLSIGYQTIEAQQDVSNSAIRRLIKLALMETSCVTFPANEEARILAAKQYLESHTKTVPPFRKMPIASEGTAWSGSKAVSQAREATGSEDEPSASYKDWFFYYDADNADSFGAYKLPKAMLVDGKASYVPKGLGAVVGALSGARGGVNIPAADKDKIKQQLNRLYKQMGREEPFPGKGLTFIDSGTIKEMEPIDMERIFDDNVVLSSGAKEYVVAAVADGKGAPDGDKDGGDDFLSELKDLNRSIKEIA